MLKTSKLLYAPLTCLMLLPFGALADMHFTAKGGDSINTAEEQLSAEITAFLEAYEVAYDTQDYRALKSMWLDDGHPIYMAEEVPFPLHGNARFDNYFNPSPGKRILDGIDNRYSEVRAKYLAPDVAVATYHLEWDIKLTGMAPMGGWDRAMAVFVKTPDGWKIAAYTEAPMGAATMVRKMMKANPARSDEEKAAYETTLKTIRSLTERSVSPGFDEFLEAHKDIEPRY
jgi:ketosteroid isomerase-like protein